MPRYGVTLRANSALTTTGLIQIGDIEVETSEGYLNLSRNVQAETIEAAEEKVRKWGETFGEILCLLTETPVEFKLAGARQLTKLIRSGNARIATATSHIEAYAFLTKDLAVETVSKVVEVYRSVARRDPNGLVRTALSWYVRGVRDTDELDSFIDGWIALETLSNLFTKKVNPYRCPGCSRIINKRPAASLLRAFLGALQLSTHAKSVAEMSAVRGKTVSQRQSD